MEQEMPTCLFGQTDYNTGSTATYVALKIPIVSEGCVLRTYQVHPGTDKPMDLPGSTFLPPELNIDEAGHVLFSQ
jgi:hypothetical protein